MKKIAEDLEMICFFSAFDKTAVDYLEKMNVPAYKVAFFEITNIPLIENIASKGKTVIVSIEELQFYQISRKRLMPVSEWVMIKLFC